MFQQPFSFDAFKTESRLQLRKMSTNQISVFIFSKTVRHNVIIKCTLSANIVATSHSETRSNKHIHKHRIPIEDMRKGNCNTFAFLIKLKHKNEKCLKVTAQTSPHLSGVHINSDFHVQKSMFQQKRRKKRRINKPTK